MSSQREAPPAGLPPTPPGTRLALGLAAAVALAATAVGLAWDRNDPASFAADGAGKATAYGRVSAGTTHSCALTAEGAIRCWGANADWQLGDGVRQWSRVPVPALGVASGVVAVAAGGTHTCALTDAGTVLCWGQEPSVVANPIAPEGSARPVPVAGLPARTVALGSGNGHACALGADGGVRCWGAFARADTSRVTLASPTVVPGLDQGARALGVGYDDQCAVTADGAVRCWGADYAGTAKDSPLASVEVLPAGTGATAVAVGGSGGCLLGEGGRVSCWLHPGQPGAAPAGGPTLLSPVQGVGAAVAISVGYAHACALTRGGGAVCWGRNSHGELGNGSTDDSAAATRVAGLDSGVVAVSAGFQHSCALLRDGRAMCWGYNFEGELGNGPSTIAVATRPIPVAPAATAPPVPATNPFLPAPGPTGPPTG